MRIACWTSKATDTHPEYIILVLLLFHVINGHANASQYYVIRTLAVSVPLIDTIYINLSLHKVKNFSVIMEVNPLEVIPTLTSW